MNTYTPNYGPQGYNFTGFNPNSIPKVMNVLSEEEIKELQQTASQFSLGLTQKEQLQAACNHRSPDGLQDTLSFDPATGIARCTICGYEFRPVDNDTSLDSIRDAADSIVDILQTIKIMYTELPAEAAREYFQIIPLIKKVPQLFEFAAKNFAKHEYNGWNYQNRNMGGAAMFQNLNNMFGASMMQQPQYGAPQGYPAQQPGMPVAGNPFGYQGASMMQPQFGAPQQPYMPNTQGFQFVPNQGQAPAAPAAPVVDAAATDTVTQKVTV